MTVVAPGVDENVVTVTIAEAQSSQTGAGKLREMQIIGSRDISESKQHCPRNNAKARRNVPSVEFNLSPAADCRGGDPEIIAVTALTLQAR